MCLSWKDYTTFLVHWTAHLDWSLACLQALVSIEWKTDIIHFVFAVLISITLLLFNHPEHSIRDMFCKQGPGVRKIFCIKNINQLNTMAVEGTMCHASKYMWRQAGFHDNHFPLPFNNLHQNVIWIRNYNATSLP